MTTVSLSRRAALRGVAASSLAAAIPATVATAIGTAPALAEAPDPIFALIAERDRVRALLKASDARIDAIQRAWPSLQRHVPPSGLEGEALKAWYVKDHAKNARNAERQRDAERSGYWNAHRENEAIGDKVCDLENEIMLTPAVTLAGAMAKLAVIEHSVSLDADGNIEDEGVLSLFGDLKRLLPGSAVAS